MLYWVEQSLIYNNFRRVVTTTTTAEPKIADTAFIIFAMTGNSKKTTPAESIFMQSDTKGWASVTSVRHVSIGHLFGLECCPHFQ